MIYVGIGVAKDKHDCFITNSDGEVLFKAFTIPNNLDCFNNLYQKIESVMEDISSILYSAAEMCPQRTQAESHIFYSNPMLALF